MVGMLWVSFLYRSSAKAMGICPAVLKLHKLLIWLQSSGGEKNETCVCVCAMMLSANVKRKQPPYHRGHILVCFFFFIFICWLCYLMCVYGGWADGRYTRKCVRRFRQEATQIAIFILLTLFCSIHLSICAAHHVGGAVQGRTRRCHRIICLVRNFQNYKWIWYERVSVCVSVWMRPSASIDSTYNPTPVLYMRAEIMHKQNYGRANGEQHLLSAYTSSPFINVAMLRYSHVLYTLFCGGNKIAWLRDGDRKGGREGGGASWHGGQNKT